MQAELLREDWEAELATLFQRASERVLISSPFVTRSGVEFLFEHLSPTVREQGRVQVLANLSPDNIVQGATEPASLQQLSSSVANTTLHHLPGLHAKVYVADTTEAIVTSGNLTAGGLVENYEYGVATRDEEAISVIREDLEEYAGLGVQVTRKELDRYVEAAQEVRVKHREQQKSQEEAARKNFEDALLRAREELIRLRLKGESTNATFAKTILYLLRKNGPMETKELHPHIQRIHPDLCDDSVDRVVAGENYGKRWKHRVRSAQSTLKQRGDIKLEEGKWKLAVEE
jgi:HKD family nuclease